MPDTDETKEQEEQEDSKQEKQEDSKAEKSDEKASGGDILPWIIMFVVLVLCGGAGFVLGRFFGGSRTTEIAE
jgi:flagellar basal body-associated protein FliL